MQVITQVQLILARHLYSGHQLIKLVVTVWFLVFMQHMVEHMVVDKKYQTQNGLVF